MPKLSIELAPLTRFHRASLLPVADEDEQSRRLKEFTLVLAASFNIIRTIIRLGWLFENSQPRPLDGAPTPALGEFSGVTWTVRLLLMLQFHSLLEKLKQYADLQGTTPFHEALKRIGPKYRADWEDLLSIANGKRGMKRIQLVLHEVRRGIAAHLDGDKLLAGYEEHFSVVTDAGRETAMASLGRSMEETRFCFADAAVTGNIKAMLKKHSTTETEMDKELGKMNTALRFLVEALMRHFDRRVARGPAAAANA